MSHLTLVQVAVDTNFLMDLAEDDGRCWECLEKLQKMKTLSRIIAPPTVMQELAHLMVASSIPEQSQLAAKALAFLTQWKITPMNFVPVGHCIVESIGDKIRRASLLPEDERHDSFVIAEAALSDCDFLVSSDTDMTGIDRDRLAQVLKNAGVHETAIISPYNVIRAL